MQFLLDMGVSIQSRVRHSQATAAYSRKSRVSD